MNHREIVPDTTHFYRGKTLDFTMTVTNNLNDKTSFTIWSEVETPLGLIVSPLPGPIDCSIGPVAVLSRHVSG